MTLDDLLKHENPYLKDLAERAKSLRAQLEAGQLSDAAYKRLVDRTVDLQTFDAALTREDMRETTAEAVELVKNFLLSKL